MSRHSLHDFDDMSGAERVKGKKHYQPFGTPIQSRLPYSQLQHIKYDDLLFFKTISVSEEDAEAFQLSILEQMSAASNKSSKSLEVKEEPCELQACRQVKSKIKEVAASNELERAKIIERLTKLKILVVTEEKKYSKIEKRNKAIKTEYDNNLNILKNMVNEIHLLNTTQADLMREKSEMENKMMVLEAEHQNLLSSVKQTQKAIATAIFNPAELNNMKKSITARSARSGNGTTPRVSGGMAITHKYFKNPITTPSDSTATHGVTGKYNDKELKEYEKLVEKLNFPIIAYTPMASTTVADSTERSITLKKKIKDSLHRYYTDNDDQDRLESPTNNESNLLAASTLRGSKVSSKKTQLAPLVPLSALSTISINATKKSNNKKLNAKVNNIIGGKNHNPTMKQRGKHSNAFDSDDDSDSDEVPEDEEIDEQEQMRRELNDVPKLNPIYYQEKAVKLYGRDHKIGKIVKKKKVNKDGEEDEDEDEEEDNDDLFYTNMGNENVITQNGAFCMSGTYRDAAGANLYRKKHFTKLFTPKHPGLSDQLMKKLNCAS